MKKLYIVLLLLSGCVGSPATEDCDTFSVKDVSIQLSTLPDGESVYVNERSLVLDKHRHAILLT